jgi:hypothetical protein
MVLYSCNINKEELQNKDTVETGWTPTDSNVAENLEILPDVLEPKPLADSILGSYLPDKVYDYKGDNEIQNADVKSNGGQKILSVVRVYRNEVSTLGINVTDLSKLDDTERNQLINYQFGIFEVLKKRKQTTVSNIQIDKNISGKSLYSLSMNKSLMMLKISNTSIITISSDTVISMKKFESVPKYIDFKRLEKLKRS